MKNKEITTIKIFDLFKEDMQIEIFKLERPV